MTDEWTWLARAMNLQSSSDADWGREIVCLSLRLALTGEPPPSSEGGDNKEGPVEKQALLFYIVAFQLKSTRAIA